MRTVEYEHNLGPGSITRVRFDKEAGRILHFVAQLECEFEEEWHPVIRYDTAHGFAHRDILRPGGQATKEDLNMPDYNEALTFAQNDIRNNWQAYRERYERWLKSESN